MVLPAPNLDDRRFQQLVDEAKRYVQQRCPEWTDHNVSDPGVTLIETFAYMVDQLLYRLNRVPDRNYVKFLELIGVRLFPPSAAQTDVTFWLSSPQPEAIRVPAATPVATVRNERNDTVVFTTSEELNIVPCSLSRMASDIGDGVRDHTPTISTEKSFYAFDLPPKPDDVLLIGLSNPVPSCAVLLRFDCEIEGVGVDPKNPPLAWEAWDGGGWAACEVDRDETGGLNRPGDVVVHVPRSHEVSVIEQQSAGWLRCRVSEPDVDQPFYSAPPKINSLTAATIGGTAPAAHVERIEHEDLGVSEGISGQRFTLEHHPVVTEESPLVLEVTSGEGWEEWTEVTSFANSGPQDPHFMLDPVNGEVFFGPAVREPDGSLRYHGGVPQKGASLRVRSYVTGGGRKGNVAAGAISVLKSCIPYVSQVTNRRVAVGGVDGEDLEDAKRRGPLLLQTRNRAVTVEDYEELAREAAPDAARIRCVSAGGDEAEVVRLLVVPAVEDERGKLRFEQLVPEDQTLERIAAYLDERRCVGARVLVEPPVYQGITVVARLKARPRTRTQRLEQDALEALYGYFHPVTGGPEGEGWPFGRPILVGEVFGVLQRVRGTELIEDARLFPTDPISGERGAPVARIDIQPHSLVFSHEHHILVEEA